MHNELMLNLLLGIGLGLSVFVIIVLHYRKKNKELTLTTSDSILAISNLAEKAVEEKFELATFINDYSYLVSMMAIYMSGYNEGLYNRTDIIKALLEETRMKVLSRCFVDRNKIKVTYKEKTYIIGALPLKETLKPEE